MDKNVRDQVVERLKTANNVLVTVSRNPSVDQLAACIGMTLLLNKLGKHATAVFSGKVPDTIEFLNPGKTLEKNTDSLRDFIIALDKSKADKLRYKVEDEVVKIFITPYKTSISQKDLEFSQGDFNVDVVLALGVYQKEDLDQAIVAHGRILHDAEVISVNTINDSALGTINWVDDKASSLSEMLVNVGQLLDRNALDTQMATAFLTGIVAETDRFSNEKVRPETMSTSSVLMNAGASTQLVAAKLEPTKPTEPQPIPKHPDSKVDLEEPAKPDGEINIAHESVKPIELVSEPATVETTDTLDYGLHDDKKPDFEEIKIDSEGKIVTEELPKPDEEKPTPPPEPTPEPVPEPPAPEPEPDLPPEAVASAHKVISEPPTVAPATDSREEMEESTTTETPDLPTDLPPPTPLLKHDTSSSASSTEITGHKTVTPPPVPAAEPKEETINDAATLEGIEESVNSPHLTDQTAPPPPTTSPTPPPAVAPAPTEAEEAKASINNARNLVNQALNNTPESPLDPVVALGSQPLGDVPQNAQGGTVIPLTPKPIAPPGETTMPGPTYVQPTEGLPANLVSEQPAPLPPPQDSAPPPGPPPMMPPPIYPT